MTGQPELAFAELLAARPAFRADALCGLCFEDIPLNLVADRFGTPTYVYGAATIRARYGMLAEALPGIAIHYAVKANDHLAILALLRSLGAGADVVSGGELARALHAGIEPGHIVFSGVGKTIAEIDQALQTGISQLNVESAEELAAISARALALGTTARIVLRVNPDVDARTHAKITTGKADNKFGIPFADIAPLYLHAANLPGTHPIGLALHIGSQIREMEPYRAAYSAAAQLVHQLRDLRQNVEVIDCGGGLGIDYQGEPQASPEAFAAVIRETLAPLAVKLMIEPGRFLVGPAGLLLASVIREKRTAARRFVVLDAAMNDLMRPSLYDAWHGIVPVAPHRFHAGLSPADVVGPICETTDIFARGRALPSLAEGERVAFLDAGAYGAVMSNTYNARVRPAEVLIQDGVPHLIRPRPQVESLWQGEIQLA